MDDDDNNKETEEETAVSRKRAKVAAAKVKHRPDPYAARNVLEQYLEEQVDRFSKRRDSANSDLVPRPEWDKREIEIPSCYGQEAVYENSPYGDKLSYAFFYSLGEIGWVATHLMYNPYTKHTIIDEANIRQSLNTVMNPRHWACGSILYEVALGWPRGFEPQTEEERDQYIPSHYSKTTSGEEDEEAEAEPAGKAKQQQQQEKQECQSIENNNRQHPDPLIRAAADAGVYLCKLRGPRCGVAGFTGEEASDRTGYDKEKDDQREVLDEYLMVMCHWGSRRLFEKLTSDDKNKIDSILGPGYSDLPALLDYDGSLTCTGAEDFDKVFPIPPPQYRLDVCDTIPYITYGLLGVFGRRWFRHVLTPSAAKILTLAVSAIMYKTYQHHDLKNKRGECSDEESNKK